MRTHFSHHDLSMQNLDLALLAVQLAEGLESDQWLISRALKHACRSSANEEDISFLEFLLFGSDADLAGTFCANDDAGAFDGFEGCFCAGLVEIGLDDAELLDRRIVESGGGAGAVCGGVEGDVGVVGWRHFLFADGSIGVCEHVGEVFDVLELWGEAGAYDVVRGSHALDDIWVVSVHVVEGSGKKNYLQRDRRECRRPGGTWPRQPRA